MKIIFSIFAKEFLSFFRNYLAYPILGIYLILSSCIMFFGQGYFQIINDSLTSFFNAQTAIFVILAPALTMKLWADERRYGTLELLLAQPVSYTSLVIGKFMSAWVFCSLLLLGTFPVLATTAFFEDIDMLHVLGSYFICWLAAGALCAVGCFVSALSSGPIQAYLFSVFLCAVIKMINFDSIFKFFHISNETMLKISQSLNFDFHYNQVILGQLSAGNVVYFVTMIIFSLWLNIVAVEYERKHA